MVAAYNDKQHLCNQQVPNVQDEFHNCCQELSISMFPAVFRSVRLCTSQHLNITEYIEDGDERNMLTITVFIYLSVAYHTGTSHSHPALQQSIWPDKNATVSSDPCYATDASLLNFMVRRVVRTAAEPLIQSPLHNILSTWTKHLKAVPDKLLDTPLDSVAIGSLLPRCEWKWLNILRTKMGQRASRQWNTWWNHLYCQ